MFFLYKATDLKFDAHRAIGISRYFYLGVYLVELHELKSNLDSDLSKQLITPSILLDNLRLINEDSRKSSAYVDPRYIPFYYYLGKYLTPQNVFEAGSGLGLFSSSFLRSCKSVENLYMFQERSEEFFSFRFAVRNVKSCYRKNVITYSGKPLDVEFHDKLSKFGWDLAIFNEEKSYDKHMMIFDLIWSKLNLNGYMVVDYVESHHPTNEAFKNFCKIKSKESILLKTRYGVGIIQK